jgi:molecular chaperone DnaJ
MGVPFLRGFGRGDQYVRVVIQTPTKLTEEEEDLLRQFAELRGEEIAPKKKGLFNTLFQN